MTSHLHRYKATLEWRGNHGDGTRHYDGYGREFEVAVPGKPPLVGSADPAFRGDPALHNPEELLLIALSSCHMLSYLALCASQHVCVLAYRDRAEAVMATDATGGGRFTGVTLYPEVVIGDAAQRVLATELHGKAHALCFIANSCNFPVAHHADIRIASAAAATAEHAR